MPSKPEIKTCSRGHRYTGPGGCPVCWSGNTKATPVDEPRRRETRK